MGGSALTAAEGAATQDPRLVVLFALPPGLSTFVKNHSSEESSVIFERRVLRQSSVVFEVRPGSKSRSWTSKMSRGTHKRQLWLINEEVIVTKVSERSQANAYRELCREFVRQLAVSDVSTNGQFLLALRFNSGFVFTAHFPSRRELEIWVSLLTSRDQVGFPWGMPFEDPEELPSFATGGGSRAVNVGDKSSEPPRQPMCDLVFHRLTDEELKSVRDRIARVEGLAAAQEAALSQLTGEPSSVRSMKKRQLRMQRVMYGALKELQALSLRASRQLFGLQDTGAAMEKVEQEKRLVAKERAVGISKSSGSSNSWSESDESTEDDTFQDLEDIPPPLHGARAVKVVDQHLPVVDPTSPSLVQREVVPPMPSAPPRRLGSGSNNWGSGGDNELLNALRRQLALKEVELVKVKNQLANVVNETWRKNLQVAQLKKDITESASAMKTELGSHPLVSKGLRDSDNITTDSSSNDNNVAVIVGSEPVDAAAALSLQPEALITHDYAMADDSTQERRFLLGLSLDVMRKVLALVSIKDLASLMLVNKQSNDIIANDDLLWRIHLMRRIPPRGVVPEAVRRATSSSKEQLRLLFEEFICAGCGALLPFGPSDNTAWQLLHLPVCRRPECFQMATVSKEDAQQVYALYDVDLSTMRSAKDPTQAPSSSRTLFRRRSVLLKSYAKYGGPEGLALRRRALFKQRQLIALSRFKPMTTRPVDLLLDDEQNFL